MTDMSWIEEYTATCDDCGAEVLGLTADGAAQWRRQHDQACEGEGRRGTA